MYSITPADPVFRLEGQRELVVRVPGPAGVGEHGVRLRRGGIGAEPDEDWKNRDEGEAPGRREGAKMPPITRSRPMAAATGSTRAIGISHPKQRPRRMRPPFQREGGNEVNADQKNVGTRVRLGMRAAAQATRRRPGAHGRARPTGGRWREVQEGGGVGGGPCQQPVNAAGRGRSTATMKTSPGTGGRDEQLRAQASWAEDEHRDPPIGSRMIIPHRHAEPDRDDPRCPAREHDAREQQQYRPRSRARASRPGPFYGRLHRNPTARSEET